MSDYIKYLEEQLVQARAQLVHRPERKAAQDRVTELESKLEKARAAK